MVLWVIKSDLEAREKLPSRPTSTKYFNCRNSITNTDLPANIGIFIVITY